MDFYNLSILKTAFIIGQKILAYLIERNISPSALSGKSMYLNNLMNQFNKESEMIERMKFICLAIALMVLSFNATSCDTSEVSDTSEVTHQPTEPQRLKSHYSDGAPMWVGKFQRTHMMQSPFDEWFNSSQIMKTQKFFWRRFKRGLNGHTV